MTDGPREHDRRNGRRATMRHVADLAQVSIKTVSRVINGESGVSPGRTTRVREAADRLGYQYNLSAGNLRRQRTGTIGVLVQDLSNAFCGDMLRAVEARARVRNVAVVTASLDDEPDRERDLVVSLVQRRCDGLILMPAGADQSYLLPEVLNGLRVVVVDRPPSNLLVDSVTVDNAGGSRAAVAHLIDRGHRRVGALLDQLDISTAGARLEGFRRAFTDAGLEIDPALVLTGLRTRDDARSAAGRLLDRGDPPTAFFCGRNSISVGAIQALRLRGLRDRVAVIGFDDFVTADLLEPALTVVRQDGATVGERAFDLLLERLDGSIHPTRSVVLPVQLVHRESGDIPGPALATGPALPPA